MYIYARKKDGLIKANRLYSKPINNPCLVSIEVPEGFSWPEIESGNRHVVQFNKTLQPKDMMARALVKGMDAVSFNKELSDEDNLEIEKKKKLESIRQKLSDKLFMADYEALINEYLVKSDQVASATTVEQVREI